MTRPTPSAIVGPVPAPVAASVTPCVCAAGLAGAGRDGDEFDGDELEGSVFDAVVVGAATTVRLIVA